jgi:hypothetical protein
VDAANNPKLRPDIPGRRKVMRTENDRAMVRSVALFFSHCPKQFAAEKIDYSEFKFASKELIITAVLRMRTKKSI